MPKIHWIGIISEDGIDKYQKGDLDSRATKMKMPKNMAEMQIKALPLLIPVLIIMKFSLDYKCRMYQQNVVSFPFIWVGVLIGFALALLHELLHAIVFPKEANTYIGILKPITFVMLASYPLSKKRFTLMCLLPYLLGIIPFTAYWFVPGSTVELNGILWGMACFGLASPYVDLYNVFQVLKQVPKGKQVQFYGNDTYYI